MLGYAVQGTLMANHYRRMDGLLATAWRGVSLGISMLPLLLLCDSSKAALTLNHSSLLVAAIVSAALGNWAAALSFRHLTTGIGIALQQAAMVLISLLLGILVFGEQILAGDYMGLALMLIGIPAISVARKNTTQHDSKPILGMLLCFIFGLCLAVSFLFVAKLSRVGDPYLTAYCWEFGIGLASFAILFIRKFSQHQLPLTIPFGDFRTILFCSSPTLIGTGCYAIAVTLGPLAIVTAIRSAMIAVSVLLSHWLYREHLTRLQYIGIAFIIFAIVVLRVFGSA